MLFVSSGGFLICVLLGHCYMVDIANVLKCPNVRIIQLDNRVGTTGRQATTGGGYRYSWWSKKANQKFGQVLGRATTSSPPTGAEFSLAFRSALALGHVAMLCPVYPQPLQVRSCLELLSAGSGPANWPLHVVPRLSGSISSGSISRAYCAALSSLPGKYAPRSSSSASSS